VGCLIGPEAVADVGTAVTGVVTAVNVDRGDTVRSGQVLVQLENEVEKSNFEAARSRATLDADIHAAESNLALARQRHARAAGLVKEGFASPQTLEQALAERDVAEQRVLQARAQKTINNHELGLVKAQLGLRALKSPFNGVVVERYVSPGERAEDKPLLRVAMLDPLRVELVMPASRWGSVALGDSVALLPELPQANSVLARVTHIDKMIDAASNTFRVRLSLPNPGNRLPAGARCKVDATAGGTAASLPSATRTPPTAALQPAAAPAPLPGATAATRPRT
jgi:RND family efflux transporter MFP subunit